MLSRSRVSRAVEAARRVGGFCVGKTVCRDAAAVVAHVSTPFMCKNDPLRGNYSGISAFLVECTCGAAQANTARL